MEPSGFLVCSGLLRQGLVGKEHRTPASKLMILVNPALLPAVVGDLS